MTVGFCSVLVAGFPPSKVQDHSVGLLVLSSINSSTNSAQSVGSPTVPNTATGTRSMIIDWVLDTSPHSLVAVSVTL